MVDFIELIDADRMDEVPMLVRKSQVMSIQPNTARDYTECYVHMSSGTLFHVKQSYYELKEQFKFE